MTQLTEVTSEVLLVTPPIARHLRDTCLFDRQRDISPRNVERLAIEMQRGRFIPGTQIYFAALPNGTSMLLNGNHTLEAVALSGCSVPLTFTYNPVEDFDEAALLYSRFDIHRARTWPDAYRAKGLENHFGNAKFQRAFGAGMTLILTQFVRDINKVEMTQSRDARLRALDSYREIAPLLIGCLKGVDKATQRLIMRGAVWGVAMETFRFQPSMAQEFWHSLARYSGLDEFDPRQMLMRFLRNNSANDKSGGGPQSKAAAMAWNHWFKKQEMRQLQPHKMPDIFILGTAWKVGYDPRQDLLGDEEIQLVVPVYEKGGIKKPHHIEDQQTSV